MGDKLRYAASAQLPQSTDLYDSLFFKVWKWVVRVTKKGCKRNNKPKLKCPRGNEKNCIFAN